jgi:hypothetical protein
MKYLSLLYLVFLIACKSNENKNAETDSLLRLDGIYQSDLQTNEATADKSTSYLRFYSDSTVINVSSSGTPQQIKSWFVKGHENVSQSTYHITGNHLTFAVDNVLYDGEIVSRDKLQLHTHSNSNNHNADVTYVFANE